MSKENKVKRYNVSLHESTWEILGEWAEDLHTSKSGIIELFVKQMNRAEKEPVGKFMEGVFQDVLEIFKTGQGPGKRRKKNS